jgi:hypothetical protein
MLVTRTTKKVKNGQHGQLWFKKKKKRKEEVMVQHFGQLNQSLLHKV